ncbi:sulfurase, partial [Sorangium cellulosum]
MHPSEQPTGTVVSIWRYPVKSMQGEEIDEAAISDRGVLGDRAYAVLDRETGHVASAKHPGKWGALLACRAAFAEPPRPSAPLPAVWITLPDGAVISSAQPDVDRALSRALGRDVALVSRPNLVVATAPDERSFVENGWIGRALEIAPEVRLEVIDPCPRCVVPTLPQGD